MSEPLNFFTNTVGRFVSGSLTNKRTKDQDNRPIPEDNQRFEFGIAFEKTAIWNEVIAGQFWPYLSSALAADANGLQRMQQWFQAPGAKGTFSMKINDGDAPNSKGRVNENTKGCFVFWFNAIDVKTCGPVNNDIDPAAIKPGFFVQVAGNIKSNGQPGDRAGIYMNGNIVRLVAEGDVISMGVDADTAFGGTTADSVQLPAGAKPLGAGAGADLPLPGGAPAPAPAPTAPAAPPAPPAAPSAPPTVPASPSEPHTGYMQPPAAPSAPAAQPGLPPLPGGA
jgi:hypothetical protein